MWILWDQLPRNHQEVEKNICPQSGWTLTNQEGRTSFVHSMVPLSSAPDTLSTLWTPFYFVDLKIVSDTPRRKLSAVAKSIITLSSTEMDEIASLDRGYRFFCPEDWWGDFGMAVFE